MATEVFIPTNTTTLEVVFDIYSVYDKSEANEECFK